MKFKNAHIVKTQEFQISLADEKDAHNIQNGISALQNTQTSYLLNKILEKYSLENEIIQFDTIELNLGIINKANYEKEILFRIEEELNNFLKTNILSNGKVLNGKKVIVSNLKLEQFELFLISGTTSWNSFSTYNPSLLFVELIQKDKENLRRTLKRIGKNEASRKRMVFHFKDNLLSQLVKLIVKEESSYILNYRENINAQHSKKPLFKIDNTKFRNSIWEVILAYIFTEKGSYQNKKAFLKHLLEKISQKHGISYKNLLHHLSEALQVNLDLPAHSFDFKKIIFELEFQESTPENKGEVEVRDNLNENTVWLQYVDYYLETGDFLNELQSISKQQFNNYLFQLLQSKNEESLAFLRNWLLDSTKKNRLLKIAQPFLQEEIKKHISFFFETIINQFIKQLELYAESQSLSANSSRLLRDVLKMRTQLFIAAFHPNVHSEKEAILYFLKSVLHKFIQKKDFLFELLEAVKAKMPNGYKASITQFNSKFREEVVSQFIKIHTREILSFIENNPILLWKYWGLLQLESWSEKLGIPKEELLQKLDKSNQPRNVVLYLKYLKNGKENVFPTEDKTSPKQQHLLKSKVLYVLKYGRLPWWANGYKEANFNADFSKLFSVPVTKKDFLLFFKDGKLHPESIILFNQANLREILKAIVQNPEKNITAFTLSILVLLEQELLTIGIISKEEISVFKRGVFQHFFTKKIIGFEENIWMFLELWLLDPKTFKSETAKKLLYNFLAKNANSSLPNSFNEKFKKALFQSVRSEKKAQQIFNKNVSLSDFIRFNFYKNISAKHFSENQGATARLIEIIDTSPHTFIDWLQEEEFRVLLLSELNDGELGNIIESNLNKTQESYFGKIRDFINDYSVQLSEKEKRTLKNLYFKLILLKLSAGGFDSWGFKQWAELVFRVFDQILGIHRTLKIFFSEDDENVFFKKKNSRILEIIFKKASIKTSQVITKQEKNKKDENYKKLDEQMDREFLNPLYINNSGLIIIAPFLGMLFEKCGLFENGIFRNDESVYKAIHLLEYAATGKAIQSEQDLAIHKVLCGINLSTPIAISIILSDSEKEIVNSMLFAVSQQWKPLKETSIESLQASFIQRAGKLEEDDEAYFLKVEQKAFDMLLDQIPWNISKIKLSWMRKILQVTWR